MKYKTMEELFYSSFKEAMNNFEVYREPLIENIDRINIIKDQ